MAGEYSCSLLNPPPPNKDSTSTQRPWGPIAIFSRNPPPPYPARCVLSCGGGGVGASESL